MNPALLLPLALVAVAGAAVAMQPAFNGQLAQLLGSPVRAALVSFSAGVAVLLCLATALAFKTGLPTGKELARVPLHLWFIGGTLGAFFVATSAWTAPRIGVGAFFATLIAAQLIAAIALDHFGLIGMEVRPATLMRVAGAGFLVLGALLVVRG